jgi:hypothetical protein
MARQIVPSGSTGYDERVTFERTDEEIAPVVTVSGDVDEVAAYEATAWTADQTVFASHPGSTFEIASSSIDTHRGRGTLTINYRQLLQTGDVEGVQELYGIDISRDIEANAYFEDLTNDEIAEVRKKTDMNDPLDAAWSDLQKSLYGHIMHGQSQYTDTYYELRWTRKTTSRRLLRVASANPNTVTALPRLSNALNKLIDSLPTGEWLKKPTQVSSVGRRGWQVVETWQWAPKWSVVYGGTFTGLDSPPA